MVSSRSADYKAPGGKLVRVRLKVEKGKIRSLHLSGDFFLVPEESLGKLEKILLGVQLQESELHQSIDHFFETARVQALGVSRDDLVKALLAAEEVSDS